MLKHMRVRGGLGVKYPPLAPTNVLLLLVIIIFLMVACLSERLVMYEDIPLPRVWKIDPTNLRKDFKKCCCCYCFLNNSSSSNGLTDHVVLLPRTQINKHNTNTHTHTHTHTHTFFFTIILYFISLNWIKHIIYENKRPFL